MTRLIFMLEGPSDKKLFDKLLPRVLPDTVTFKCIEHEGKSRLEQSIRNKLKSWNVPGDWFVVVRDKDRGDCLELKAQLRQLCEAGGRPETLIRIAVHELESWFLGDLQAVERGFDITGLSGGQSSRKYRNPDLLPNAYDELKKLVKDYQKVSGAEKITPHLNIDSNQSESFRQLLSGLKSYVGRIQD